ncbi:hypothetical protein BCIN_10g03270 [Botrytis cinerea B05.10]|uniref:Heterokaryon incompatibility domain-containing protein n=3 Tax=Botryotinia fuckeliana TaxID=40559 RepID=A0A384JVN4_BOTFB|nr:hypothetical protein BCIN_10g03270 [Botrytis cinerea B05.10]ATZ54317.1 hypothetical protein BCIN_10g03270 [Botrytis cinerea B05.10]EMR89626.1 putative het-domain-containing protein [Botrytis cinerea BcDW1]CCD44993.1 hypothetical protein BofuT4_P051020.1 [Botrytis cinerea T4]
MGDTSSSYTYPDYSIERYLDEEEIHEAVSAAGKKAKTRGLCKRCDHIVGWFFLDQEVFRRTFREIWGAKLQPICDLEVNEFKPSCTVCNFLHSIRPKNEENEDERSFRLGRSTVGHIFDYMHAYDNVPIFYLVPGDSFNFGRRRIKSPTSNTFNTVFGFSNADAYKDGVAIRHLSSNADLSLVRGWIRLCDDNHTNSDFDCLPKVIVPLQGFTVIDCKDGRNTLVPGTTSMQYITLSYVWGTEVSDVPDRIGRLPATLPNLIKGVIEVVMALGYRYLWIDRYCVPQTDSGIKSYLLQNMDKIYSQSILTIIAATSKCPNDGLAGITRPRMVVQESLEINSVHLVQWVSNIQFEIENSVWNTRGWTYQEALLSRRRLVLTETQCYFQCDAGGDWSVREGSRMESIDHDLTTKRELPYKNRIPIIFPPRPKRFIDDELKSFESRVSSYAKKQLSKSSDVLPAFLGLLGMFVSECSAFYGHIYGVPIFEPSTEFLSTDTIGTLITGITWHFDTEFNTLEDVTEAAIPTRRRALPSWKWCDWIHASPSPYSIKWEKNILNVGLMRRDIVCNTRLSLEFEDGTILSWTHGDNVAGLTRKAMGMGNVHCIHIVGWFTHLSIPVDLSPGRSWQLWGRYGIESVKMHWLRRLAKEQGMNVSGNKEYVFKAWVFAPVIEPSISPRNSWNDVHMMLLGETSDPVTFERIEVCKVSMELKGGEEGKGRSVKDIAEIFGWEMKAFKLA